MVGNQLLQKEDQHITGKYLTQLIIINCCIVDQMPFQEILIWTMRMGGGVRMIDGYLGVGKGALPQRKKQQQTKCKTSTVVIILI